MTEEEFMSQIAPVPSYDAFYFTPPDWSLGSMASTRVYITFQNADDIFVFRDRFDGYVFVDGKGTEYIAVVEFAPFQGLSKSRSKKKDPKCNTIETDPHYLAFIEALKAAETEPKTESKLEYSYQLKEEAEVTSTPLLEYLANKKQEKINERKRKADEKKRKRDEDRLNRKKQVAKNIPNAIKEEPTKDRKESGGRGDRDSKVTKSDEKKKSDRPSSSNVQIDEDGIMVRVVPSRLDRNQRKPKEQHKDESEPKRDRNKSRREAREAKRAEKRLAEKGDNKIDSKPKDDPKPSSDTTKRDMSKPTTSSTRKVTPITEEPISNKQPSKASSNKPIVEKPIKKNEPVRREVKKYSERRKEIRARAENRRNEAEDKPSTSNKMTKVDLDVGAQEFIPKKSSDTGASKEETPSDAGMDSVVQQIDSTKMESESSAEKSGDEKSSKEKHLKEVRCERRIPNKQRPSIQIYQPRRVRIAATFSSDQENKEKPDTPDSDAKSTKEEILVVERKHSRSDKGDRKERKHRSEHEHRKKKSKSGDEGSREISRQNSQGSELGESKPETSDENEKSKGDEINTTVVMESLKGLEISEAETLNTKDLEGTIKD